MEEGDIIHVDYDLYNGETGDLIETTREATAQEHEMHDENRTYQPMVCVVGSGSSSQDLKKPFLRQRSTRTLTLNSHLLMRTVRKDATMIETISIDKLRRAVRDPNALYLGAPVNIGGRQGYLSFLAAGRARIDYNHPMAGKTLKYNFKIVKVVEGKEEKVAALLESNTGHSDFGVTFDGDDLGIVIPQTMLFDTNAAMMKFRLVTVLRDAVECAKVSFIEEHEPRVIAEEEVNIEGRDISQTLLVQTRA